MSDRPQNVLRKVIGGKEYSCKKLPYRKARPLQMRLGAVLAPLMTLAQSDGNMQIADALPLLVAQLGDSGTDLIIDLCETCMVEGHTVNVDMFNPDEAYDIQVAALALETHFANFIKGLQSVAGDLMPSPQATTS